AVVPLAGALVEGALADHVRHGQQEELTLGVAHVPGRALVGAAGRGRLGDDGAECRSTYVRAVEFRHDGSTPFAGRVRGGSVMVRDSGVPEFVIGDGGLWQTCPKNRSPL